MKIKKTQLSLLINNILMEQEDTGFGRKVADTAERGAVALAGVGHFDNEAQIVIDAAKKISIMSPIETGMPATKTALEELQAYSMTPEGKRKWSGFTALMASSGGKWKATKTLYTGAKTIVQVLGAAGAGVGGEAAIATAASAAGTVAAVAAVEAVLIGYAAWYTGEAIMAAAQVVAQEIASGQRGEQKVNKFVIDKLFTIGVKRAKKQGFSKEFFQKAYRQINGLAKGTSLNSPELFIILSFLSGADVVKVIKELRKPPSAQKDFQLVAKMDGYLPTLVLHTTGESDFGKIRPKAYLGAQLKFINLIKQSKEFAKEAEKESTLLIKKFTKDFKEKDLPS